MTGRYPVLQGYGRRGPRRVHRRRAPEGVARSTARAVLVAGALSFRPRRRARASGADLGLDPFARWYGSWPEMLEGASSPLPPESERVQTGERSSRPITSTSTSPSRSSRRTSRVVCDKPLVHNERAGRAGSSSARPRTRKAPSPSPTTTAGYPMVKVGARPRPRGGELGDYPQGRRLLHSRAGSRRCSSRPGTSRRTGGTDPARLRRRRRDG